MGIPMNAECYLCHLKKNVEFVQSVAGEAAATGFARDLMQLYLDAPKHKGSPWFGPGVTALTEAYCGPLGDRYRQEKEASNRFVLERLEDIRRRIVTAPDPVYAGMQMAVLGNYIDFSALRGEVSFDKLEQMLEKAHEFHLEQEAYARLCGDLKTAGSLVYITDNAGEIGFDRLLAEVLQETYPQLSITFCVRGGCAANDATRADALAVGVPFPIIDNGCTVAGTELELLTDENRALLEQADVLIAKGQANVETLWGCGLNVYYLFLVKCARFIHHFGKPQFTPMLLGEL